MAVDTDRLVAGLAHIRTHPEEWDQQHWHCGTTFCLAGHVSVTLNGDRLVPAGSFSSLVIPAEGGQAVPISERAANLLGLDSEQAAILFDGSNTLDVLDALVAALKDGADAAEMLDIRRGVLYPS